MTLSSRIAPCVIALAIAAPTFAAEATLAVQPPPAPGKIGFKAQNKMFKADGQFKAWKFTKVDIPGGDFEKGTVEIEIDTASVEANNPKLTNHLQQDDMLKVAAFPKATVKVHSAKKVAEGQYKAIADLTLLGVTKSLPAEFKVTGKAPVRVEGTAVLNRTEFGVYQPYDPANDKSVEPSVQISVSATLPDKP
jgi:polyisoprenoid-binding protein YceI